MELISDFMNHYANCLMIEMTERRFINDLIIISKDHVYQHCKQMLAIGATLACNATKIVFKNIVNIYNLTSNIIVDFNNLIVKYALPHFVAPMIND